MADKCTEILLIVKVKISFAMVFIILVEFEKI